MLGYIKVILKMSEANLTLGCVNFTNLKGP